MIRRSHKLLLSVGFLASMAVLQFAAARTEVSAPEHWLASATGSEAWTNSTLSFLERVGLICESAECEEHEQ